MKGELPFAVPSGLRVAPPPSAEALRWDGEQAENMIERHVMYLWRGVGWCEGKITKRNLDPKVKIGKDVANFWVHYPVDDDESMHNLELAHYRDDTLKKHPYNTWVLLEEAPAGSLPPLLSPSEVPVATATEGDEGTMVAAVTAIAALNDDDDERGENGEQRSSRKHGEHSWTRPVTFRPCPLHAPTA